MGSNFSKTEKAIFTAIVLVAMVFVGLFALLNRHTKSGINFSTETGINYKMARPDQVYSEYTLEGRELDQVYEGLPENIKKDLTKRKEALIAKKNAETKKVAETKKKDAVAAKAKDQAKAAQKAQASAARKQQLLKDLNATNDQVASTTNQDSGNAQAYSDNNNSAPVTEDVKTKPKKTYAEWRTQIFSAQSSDAIGQFVVAFRKNEVTSTEFQAMATDLLDQDDNKLKGLGLMLLRSVPSLASLSQLVHAQAALPATYQSYVEQSYIAYFYPQNLNYMKAALQTSDHTLLSKVISLLQSKLTSLSNGDQTVFTDARNSRANNAASATITMASFVTLIPNLTILGTTPNSDLASAAQSLVALISTRNNVAQN